MSKKSKIKIKLKSKNGGFVDFLGNVVGGVLNYLDLDGGELSTGNIPHWIRNKQTGNDGKEVPREKPPRLPQPVDPNPNGYPREVYREPVIIYQNNDFRTNNYYPNLPSKPSSLLPIEDGQEVLNQTPTRVKIGAPITLTQSIKSQKFGQMLFNPFSEEKQKIRQISNSSIAEDLESLNEIGIDKFAGYLAKEKETTVLDAIVLLNAVSPRGLSGGYGFIFGVDTIRYLFANFTASSVNALIGVTDVIPDGYEIEEYDPKKDTDKLEPIDIKLLNADITLDQILDVPINWESWIEKAVTEQYGEENDERNPVAVTNFVDFFKNAIAPFYFRAGMTNFPFVLPKTLTEDPQGKEKEVQVTANGISEFMLWQVQAFDSVLGQFPINIRIDDTDLIQTGDQELRLNFPNLSETLTELIGLALSNQTNNNAMLKMGLIELAEVGQTKQQAIQNYYLLGAIQEYLGFKSKQIIKDVDFLFNPGILVEEEEKQTLENVLKPAKLKVSIESNNDDETLEKQLYQLIEAARIIKAVHWQNVDLQGNPGGQIANIIKQASKLADALDFKDSKDLEAFLKDVELGFTNKIPEKDPTKPYGRNYSERPKVKYNKPNDDYGKNSRPDK